MSNAERVHRGFILDESYKWCSGNFEDLDHVFRKYVVAVVVWQNFLPQSTISSFPILILMIELELAFLVKLIVIIIMIGVPYLQLSFGGFGDERMKMFSTIVRFTRFLDQIPAF